MRELAIRKLCSNRAVTFVVQTLLGWYYRCRDLHCNDKIRTKEPAVKTPLREKAANAVLGRGEDARTPCIMWQSGEGMATGSQMATDSTIRLLVQICNLLGCGPESEHAEGMFC